MVARSRSLVEIHMDDVDVEIAVLAGLVGITIGVGVALLWTWWFNQQTVPVQAAAQAAAPPVNLQVLRDEHGRILQVQAAAPPVNLQVLRDEHGRILQLTEGA